MEKIEERESVILKNAGQKIFGIIHRPCGLKKCPAVMFCHGLGGHKTGKYRLYVNLASKLSRIGIASFRFDFRGSGDSEGEFNEMTIDSQVSDALLALDFLEKDPQIDSSRLGIFGRSFGGLVSLMSAYRYGNIKSMALWAPVVSGDQWRDKWHILQTHQLNPESKEDMMRVNGMVPGYQFFEQLFSLHLEKEVTSLEALPVFHVHGEKDVIVNLSHADRFFQWRRNAKSENKFIRLPGSDHDFSYPPEQKYILEETSHWFRRTLFDE